MDVHVDCRWKLPLDTGERKKPSPHSVFHFALVFSSAIVYFSHSADTVHKPNYLTWDFSSPLSTTLLIDATCGWADICKQELSRTPHLLSAFRRDASRREQKKKRTRFRRLWGKKTSDVPQATKKRTSPQRFSTCSETLKWKANSLYFYYRRNWRYSFKSFWCCPFPILRICSCIFRNRTKSHNDSDSRFNFDLRKSDQFRSKPVFSFWNLSWWLQPEWFNKTLKSWYLRNGRSVFCQNVSTFHSKAGKLLTNCQYHAQTRRRSCSRPRGFTIDKQWDQVPDSRSTVKTDSCEGRNPEPREVAEFHWFQMCLRGWSYG